MEKTEIYTFKCIDEALEHINKNTFEAIDNYIRFAKSKKPMYAIDTGKSKLTV